MVVKLPYLKRMPDTSLSQTMLIDRAIIRLSGEEAGPFLQGLVTQDVMAMEPDRPRWSGLLTPQGKALFDFLLWADGEDVLIDCEAAQADALARRLTLYRLRRKVEIRREEGLAVHWAPPGEKAAAGKPADPRLPELGHRWIAPVDPTYPQAYAQTCAQDCVQAWRRHRLSLNVLEGVEELGQDQTLWLEANAEELNGVDYKKGCYVGQENTARMHYRHKVNRRLVVVPIAMADEKRQRLALPDLGLSIEHRRVEDMAGLPLPAWLAAAIAETAAQA